MEKGDIRKEIFRRRKLLTKEQLERDSRTICRKIMETKEWKEASCVYAYMDCKNEVSMQTLLEAGWREGKRMAVPKVFGKEMRFFFITSYEDVEPGYFGIREPVTTKEAFGEQGLMIVPGVAFDAKRHRCGYGGGFYDRYLAEHGELSTIAPAFDFQIVEQVPVHEFDIFPQKVFTETKAYEE